MFEQKSVVLNDEVTINIPSVQDWNVTQLRYCCKKNKVKGYTTMTKEQMVDEVKKIWK
ncbi:MAG: hypothetical protein RR891_02605 [Clostridium sp.]